MENPEEVLHALDEFAKIKPKDIPQELEKYMQYVALSGDPVYQWSLIKSLFRQKLINVISEFFEICPLMDNIPPCPNVEPFVYDVMKKRLLERFDTFIGAPFTIQRLAELLTNPMKQYNRVDKFMRAVEKNIWVVSTREPGRCRGGDSSSENTTLVNGVLAATIQANNLKATNDRLERQSKEDETEDNALPLSVDTAHVPLDTIAAIDANQILTEVPPIDNTAPEKGEGSPNEEEENADASKATTEDQPCEAKADEKGVVSEVVNYPQEEGDAKQAVGGDLSTTEYQRETVATENSTPDQLQATPNVDEEEEDSCASKFTDEAAATRNLDAGHHETHPVQVAGDTKSVATEDPLKYDEDEAKVTKEIKEIVEEITEVTSKEEVDEIPVDETPVIAVVVEEETEKSEHEMESDVQVEQETSLDLDTDLQIEKEDAKEERIMICEDSTEGQAMEVDESTTSSPMQDDANTGDEDMDATEFLQNFA